MNSFRPPSPTEGPPAYEVPQLGSDTLFVRPGPEGAESTDPSPHPPPEFIRVPGNTRIPLPIKVDQFPSTWGGPSQAAEEDPSAAHSLPQRHRIPDVYTRPPLAVAQYVGKIVDHVASLSPDAPELVVPASMDYLRDAPDDEPVDHIDPKELSLPNVIEVETPGELYEAYVAYNDLLKSGRTTERDLRVIRGDVKHEREHDLAYQAEDVQPEETKCGLWVMRRPVSTLSPGDSTSSYAAKVQAYPYTRAQRLSTTKLGYAAIVAAPLRPSPIDITTLEGMGYESVVDVARRVIAHNERAPRPLPVPKIANMPWFKLRD